MSLKHAKAFKSGILISTPTKKTLIVPFKISFSINYDKGVKFQENINRQLFFYFYSTINRYTISFSRDPSTTNPELLFNLYFTSPTQRGLYLKASQALKNIKRNLSDLGVVLVGINTRHYLQQLLDIPQSIEEVKPLIFNISTAKTTRYISLVKLLFKDNDEMRSLLLLLRDLYAILPKNTLNLDIDNSPLKKDSTYKSKAAITITLESSVLDELFQARKKLDSLLNIFCDNRSSDELIQYQFVKQQEFQENFGKILLGQGWEFMPCDYTNLLNYAAFLNLLLDVQ